MVMNIPFLGCSSYEPVGALPCGIDSPSIPPRAQRQHLIEHRDRHCIVHLSKVDLCPHTPAEVRKEAIILLAAQAGEIAPISESATHASLKSSATGSQGTPIDVDDQESRPTKKQKMQSSITTFVDQAMGTELKKTADYYLLRCVTPPVSDIFSQVYTRVVC